MSKPHQDRQERWQELRWASHIHWCLSGRLAHLGIRCDHAAGLASGSLGKSQWQGYPPKHSKQTNDLAQNRRNGTTLPSNVMKQNELWLFFLLFFSCFVITVLTARMNRLSVAAGNISFSNFIFLQWRYCWYKNRFSTVLQ